MLKTLHLKNFTVFADADLMFGRNLNVIVGENGTGKSHLLKVAYAALAVSAQRRPSTPEAPTKTAMETELAEKLLAVFRPDTLGRLARRSRGHSTCELAYTFEPPSLNLTIRFSTSAKSSVNVIQTPTSWADKPPVFVPTRELLTIYPGFVSLYETTHTQFDETWRDTCLLLGRSLARGPRETSIKKLLVPIEEAMGGYVSLEQNGQFYLITKSGSLEMHLVAEGLRKLAMLARLIANGSLLGQGYLFWDEPEANLNPKVIRAIARVIVQLAQSGVQVFIASHSLFLLRELYIIQQQPAFKKLDTRCFGLHLEAGDTVTVSQGATIDDIGDISALDEELAQSDRYLETESQ